ncbi:MAG: 50S ribosomal protein L30 [Calditrichaeota bacterium]|nr:50S ribosomal protein L30 [Calditrichota bacterium]
MPEYLQITWVRSAIGRSYRQKRIIKALGFRRLQSSRILEDNQTIRGMINKVEHLLKIESVEPPLENDNVKDEKVAAEIEALPIDTEKKTDADAGEDVKTESNPESETETEKQNDA